MDGPNKRTNKMKKELREEGRLKGEIKGKCKSGKEILFKERITEGRNE